MKASKFTDAQKAFIIKQGEEGKTVAVNGGVKVGQRGGAKVGHSGVRALERAALI